MLCRYLALGLFYALVGVVLAAPTPMVRVQELADDQVANLPRTGVPKGTLNHALMTDFDASELEYVSSSMDMSEYDHDTLFTDGLDETDEDVLFIFANMDDNGFDSSLLTEHEQDLLELALFMRRKHISLDMWSYEDNVEGDDDFSNGYDHDADDQGIIYFDEEGQDWFSET